MTYTYRNPYYERFRKPDDEPPVYSTSEPPATYRGFLLFNRIPGTICDVVKYDGSENVLVTACVTQAGAKRVIDIMLGGEK